MKKLIPLKEAAKISNYHPDYLGYLIRNNKVEGEKVGRDWLINEELLRNYLDSKKFNSLKDIILSKRGIKIGMAMVLILILIFIGAKITGTFFAPSTFSEKTAENSGQKSNTKDVEELKITAYSVTENGEIELSIKKAAATPKNNPSIIQKIINFLIPKK